MKRQRKGSFIWTGHKVHESRDEKGLPGRPKKVWETEVLDVVVTGSRGSSLVTLSKRRGGNRRRWVERVTVEDNEDGGITKRLVG